MDRAELLLMGWFVGDGFGGQTDGMEESEVASLIDGPITEVYTLEEAQSLSGQSGPASDTTILCGLSVMALEQVDNDHLASKYRAYDKESGAFPFPQKGDNAACLTRAPIMALLDARFPYTKWEAVVKAETRLTHTAPLAIDAALLLSRTFALLVNEEAESAQELCSLLIREVGKRGWDAKLEVALRTAVNQKTLNPYTFKERYQIIPTITLAFHTLLSPLAVEEGLDAIARLGGNSRLTCAIYSALKVLADHEEVPERYSSEIYPSPTIEAMIKSETLFKRETIKMEKLAEKLAKGLTV
mgnify:CR=1 FL=1|jgi:ADP-ribosylglycohydrolase